MRRTTTLLRDQTPLPKWDLPWEQAIEAGRKARWSRLACLVLKKLPQVTRQQHLEDTDSGPGSQKGKKRRGKRKPESPDGNTQGVSRSYLPYPLLKAVFYPFVVCFREVKNSDKT